LVHACLRMDTSLSYMMQFIVSNLLEPAVFGNRLKLHPVIVIMFWHSALCTQVV
jgi:hypothetical protein